MCIRGPVAGSARRDGPGPRALGAAVGLVLAARALVGGESLALAAHVRREAGFRGGLVVHLACGGGELTAALRSDGQTVVQGLDRDALAVDRARQHVRSLGLYGPVSVGCLEGDLLPYADGTVNLVVDEGLAGLPREEVLRVLAPGGKLCTRVATGWEQTTKARPPGLDEWTHYLHDASGNPVARDAQVAPPTRLQWSAGPRYSSSHEHTPTLAALVSAGGRIVFFEDTASTESILSPAQWHLVARDAFNGLLLWRRPVESWWPRMALWTSGPRQLQRRLVAVGERVYATLGYYDPVRAMAAATGEILQTYEGTRGAEEIVLHEGVLLAAVRDVTDERRSELGQWAGAAAQKDSPLARRETMDPWLKRLRGVETKAAVSIVAVDVASGRELWRRDLGVTAGLRSLSLSAAGRHGLAQIGGKVCCFDLLSGKELWSVPAPPFRLASERAVVCADGKTAMALALDTGQTLWTQALTLCEVRDAFAIGGSLWLGGFKPFDTGNPKHTGPVWGPYCAVQHDLATGALLGQIDPENPGHHHRCYQNKATERYLIGGRRGTEFIDLERGEVLWHNWARGVCQYGVMPANGMLYVPPHACGCYATVKLSGFSALTGGPPQAGGGGALRPGVAEPLRGPAYPVIPKPGAEALPADEWPGYRRDGQRSGSTPMAVSAALRPLWQVGLRGRLGAPVVAEHRLLSVSVDDHRLAALDAESGRSVWEFTAGARVDSPPTVWGGQALFGCRDGYLYSLRLADGALAWRLQVARSDRRIVVDGQLEAASPLFGSVLVREGVVYATAGVSSYLDGGIDLCRIDAQTGKLLSRTPLYSPDPVTGKAPPQISPAAMPGARADLLSADADHVYLRDLAFGPDGGACTEANDHLLAVTGFLDDAWAHRSYLIFGRQVSLAGGCSGRAKDLLYGRLLVFDGSRFFGYGRKAVHWSNQLEDGPYHVFAVNRGDRTRPWSRPVPIQVRAMVLAGETLFLAGPPVDEQDAQRAAPTDRGALLLALSAADGQELGQHRLESLPTFDGMAAAYGRLYLTTGDGTVLCLAGSGL